MDENKLSSSELSVEEKIRLKNSLEPLVKFLGSPGDWGRSSRLGKFTIEAMQINHIVSAELLGKDSIA